MIRVWMGLTWHAVVPRWDEPPQRVGVPPGEDSAREGVTPGRRWRYS